jgi:hypothetical protein
MPKGKGIAVGKISRLAHLKGMAAKEHRLRMSRKTNPNDLALFEVKGPGVAPAGMTPPPQGGPTPAPDGQPGRGKLQAGRKPKLPVKIAKPLLKEAQLKLRAAKLSDRKVIAAIKKPHHKADNHKADNHQADNHQHRFQVRDRVGVESRLRIKNKS